MMLDYEMLKELNERIIERAMLKSADALDKKDFDKECFEVMSESIENIARLQSINKYDSEPKGVTLLSRMNAKEETTEFEQLIYDIMEKHSDNPSTYYLAIETIAEVVEDMKILNNRMYNILMNKLKGMLI